MFALKTSSALRMMPSAKKTKQREKKRKHKSHRKKDDDGTKSEATAAVGSECGTEGAVSTQEGGRDNEARSCVTDMGQTKFSHTLSSTSLASAMTTGGTTEESLLLADKLLTGSSFSATGKAVQQSKTPVKAMSNTPSRKNPNTVTSSPSTHNLQVKKEDIGAAEHAEESSDKDAAMPKTAAEILDKITADSKRSHGFHIFHNKSQKSSGHSDSDASGEIGRQRAGSSVSDTPMSPQAEWKMPQIVMEDRGNGPEITLQQQQHSPDFNKSRRSLPLATAGSASEELLTQQKAESGTDVDGTNDGDERKKQGKSGGGGSKLQLIFGRGDVRSPETNQDEITSSKGGSETGSDSSEENSSQSDDMNIDDESGPHMDDHRAPLGMDTMLKFEDKLKIISRKLNIQREQVRTHMTLERSHRKHSRPTFRMPTFAVLSPTARLAPIRRRFGTDSEATSLAGEENDAESAEPSVTDVTGLKSSVSSLREDGSLTKGCELDMNTGMDEDASALETIPVPGHDGDNEEKSAMHLDEAAVDVTVEWTPSEARFRSKLAAHTEALDALQEQLASIVKSLPPDDHHELFDQNIMDIEDFSDAMGWTLSTDAGSVADFCREEKTWEQSFNTSISELLQYTRDLEESMKRTERLTATLEQEAKRCEETQQENYLSRRIMRSVRSFFDIPAVQRRNSPFGISRYVPCYARWFQPFEAIVYHMLPMLGSLSFF